MIDAVIARLNADVTALSGRVEGAAQLVALQRQKALPQTTPAAFVVPVGLTGGKVTALAGAFVQEVTDTIAVILIMRGNDPRGSHLLDPLKVLIDAVLASLAGWAPENSPGVLTLRSGRTVSLADGAWIYQIEFSLFDQLRIAR